jgi:hypothetical protein
MTTSRTAFVHEATVLLDEGADQQAPGAAVTVALCGHWKHEGACRWPHRTVVADRSGNALTVRVVFVSDPEEEADVRTRLVASLRVGALDGPTGTSRWKLTSESVSTLTGEEQLVAAKLGSLPYPAASGDGTP